MNSTIKKAVSFFENIPNVFIKNTPYPETKRGKVAQMKKIFETGKFSSSNVEKSPKTPPTKSRIPLLRRCFENSEISLPDSEIKSEINAAPAKPPRSFQHLNKVNQAVGSFTKDSSGTPLKTSTPNTSEKKPIKKLASAHDSSDSKPSSSTSGVGKTVNDIPRIVSFQEQSFQPHPFDERVQVINQQVLDIVKSFNQVTQDSRTALIDQEANVETKLQNSEDQIDKKIRLRYNQDLLEIEDLDRANEKISQLNQEIRQLRQENQDLKTFVDVLKFEKMKYQKMIKALEKHREKVEKWQIKKSKQVFDLYEENRQMQFSIYKFKVIMDCTISSTAENLQKKIFKPLTIFNEFSKELNNKFDAIFEKKH